MVAVHKEPHKVDLRDINFKEQILIGTRVYTKEEFRQAVRYLSEIAELLRPVMTHIIPLQDASKVFELIAAPAEGTLKVLIDCRAV